MRQQLIEGLESRLAFSVSGASLVNLTPGTTLTYNILNNGVAAGTTSQTVNGPKTIKRVATIMSTYTQGASNGKTTTSTYNVSNRKGQFLYRSDSVAKGTGGTQRSSTSYSNPTLATLFPGTLVAGTIYRNGWTRTDTTSVNGAAATSNVFATTFSVELKTEKARRITVPAGTFHCYVIYETTTFKIDGQTQIVNSTDYVTPGVGIIEQQNSSVVSTSPHAKTLSSTELASFKLGK